MIAGPLEHLRDSNADWIEQENIAAQNLDKVKELQAKFG